MSALSPNKPGPSRRRRHKLSPKKLLSSKWTRVEPIDWQKHFMVVKVTIDEDGVVVLCHIEAIINRKRYRIDWRELNDDAIWLPGWR
ncbi:TIGR02450 family Trp-rich protein [Ferrimonas pelagia]|uniref:TIGR02450 family Trp-rich protein n=1 Tax=Ferrimonas pelagia TaxID=1177826 RepID=A0ABP9FMZ5_9GAMM